MPNTRTTSGTVLWRSPRGEFGLITPDGDGQPDLFVHRCDMATEPGAGQPAEGDAVVYELCDSARGPWARNVRKRD
ncbi:cold-shock protein [Streptomyces sp. NBC_00096]|uniref:cold-shock protein n=1 Tax=Streptomyces sp. NBC_00096 TaxID=2975650 RepID=UPI003253DAC7